MIVVLVPFSIEAHKMLRHTKWLLDEKEDGSSLIAIDKGRFHKLVTSLSTAIANEYKLDKEQHHLMIYWMRLDGHCHL